MPQFTSRRHRRWWILGAIFIVAGIAAVPVAGVVHHMVGNAVGRTTVSTSADGNERTIYWRDYPGVAGVDPLEVLAGPTPEEGNETARTMVAEIKAALSAEFRQEWAPVDAQSRSPFHGPIENQYGGKSLLTNVNGPESQSTSVPQTWAEKQRAIAIIGDVTHRYGYGPR